MGQGPADLDPGSFATGRSAKQMGTDREDEGQDFGGDDNESDAGDEDGDF